MPDAAAHGGGERPPGSSASAVAAFLERLSGHGSAGSLGSMVAHRRRIEGRPAAFADPAEPLPPVLAGALRYLGIGSLYEHQARALDAARAGSDLLAVTPTASGKTLVFALPVLETVLREPRARALFLYPTKALAQDQVGSLNRLAAGIGALRPPRFEIYDGDTPAALRRRIRSDPPEVLVTNPDMLHLGILAHHREWAGFLRDLRFIVLDELHVYRGVFGAHVHHVLRRLRRIAEGLGARPRFVAASATVGNPAEFARTLTGRRFEVIDRSGAPVAAREVVFLNPSGVSPYTAAVRVVAECVTGGLRTIAFTKARRVTELLHTWLARQRPELAGRVAPYRAGYLPQERREIESRLFRGELGAVLSTSALELGIDVGELDACVLVGYPGSLISSWQRIGRVGRQDREALIVLIAMPDALDQYLVRHPGRFFDDAFEPAVLDPWNPYVAGHHLVCAAAEEPLSTDELDAGDSRARELAGSLADQGRLARDAEGRRWYSFRRQPHRDANLRSAGEPHAIVAGGGKLLGHVDGMRVMHECHPGAIYLHRGQSYRVLELDRDARRVRVERVRVDYYTVVLGEKETEILETRERNALPVAGGATIPAGLGRLKVTVRIRGYQKKRLFGGEPISTHPLEAPPLVFETIGFWIELPPGLPRSFAERELHFMGGIHATEHAMIGLFPLLAIADRGDVGGISYTGHPQLGAPAVFLYDGVPGGAGLAERGFRELATLLDRTCALVAECDCEDGCPGCIQSPKCGNGNKPLDKRAALWLLRLLLAREALPDDAFERPAERVHDPGAQQPGRHPRRHGIVRAGNVEPAAPAEPPPPPVREPAAGWIVPAGEPAIPVASPPTGPPAGPAARAESVLVLDLETRRSAEEVGGWGRTHRMGLALAVVFDGRRSCYRTYYEADVHRLLLDLVMADRVVGFNIERFDLAVLSGYTDWDLGRIRTCDMLRELRRPLGYRLSLAHLAEVNLGEAKAGDGMQSLAWWKAGRLDLIESYCRKDVELTRRLYELGRRRGYLLYRDRLERTLRVPVRW